MDVNYIRKMVATKQTRPLHGVRATITLQGEEYPATIRATFGHDLIAVFDERGVYFGRSTFKFGGHDFNNFTAHAFEGLGNFRDAA